jgi:hypothetical protein
MFFYNKYRLTVNNIQGVIATKQQVICVRKAAALLLFV